METEAPITRAIRAAGGDEAFMATLGIKRRTLFYLKKGQRLDPMRAIAIEAATGVPRHELLPEVFSAPAATKKRQAA
jgi:DNA-binding transcriptional regulator YdaS (Cro superfamily)